MYRCYMKRTQASHGTVCFEMSSGLKTKNHLGKWLPYTNQGYIEKI